MHPLLLHVVLLHNHSVSAAKKLSPFLCKYFALRPVEHRADKSRCVWKEWNNRHQIFESLPVVAAQRRSAAESMLPTWSSGYTVLSPQWSLRPAWGAALPSERDAHRATPEQRSAEPLSDSIGVACNRLLILTRPAALCVFLRTWQCGRSQELRRRRAASLPLIGPWPHRSSISQKGLCNALLAL